MNGKTGHNNDNFMSLPLHSPLHQQVAVVGDGTTLIEAARKIADRNKKREDWDESFLVGDVGLVLDQYKRWKRELPRVEVFYAVKANALRPVVNTLAALGCGFNCASKNELSMILDLGVKPEKIIYAHTCKMASHLCYARDRDVTTMTFDNEEELLKIERLFPQARLVLRIKTEDNQARTLSGDKFGASTEYAQTLITKAKDLNLDVVGISFHVGNRCPNPQTFKKAIQDSKMLFNFGRENGFQFKVLDIGGGFPGSEEADEVVSFESMATVIREALAEYFPVQSGVKIIAEPGKFFPGKAFALATCVHSKKKANGRVSYHVPESICMSFLEVFMENAKVQPVPLKKVDDKALKPTTVYGISCTGIDIIAKDTSMVEINIGDWMFWKDLGGYLAMKKIGFNGFTTYKACYFITESKLEELCSLCTDLGFLSPTRSSI